MSQDYMNEECFERNRLPARAYNLPQHTHCLSGKWDFCYAQSPREAHIRTNDEAWTTIDVPGHWQLQGHGRPQYTNINLPIPCDPPNVPASNPIGIYETTFITPADWISFPGGLTYRLRFEGVDSAFHCFVNDGEVGYSQGSRNAAEFRIDNFCKANSESSNRLRVVVYQWSDGSFIEDQDMWWLSGIFRDVYLIAYPKNGHIEDFFVKTIFDDALRDATLQIDLDYETKTRSQIKFQLKDPRTGVVCAADQIDIDGKNNSLVHQLKIAQPHHWSAETPFLYDLRIELLVQDYSQQKIEKQIGFRKVSIEGGLLRVNDIPILLRGVNRHDHHPKYGRAVPLEYLRRDLTLMKQHNINALRTSHYPNDPRLVQIADEIGLFVMDEADLECHGTGIAPEHVPSDKPSWKPAYLERMKQLVHRDKNSPSVILWSLGNESFYGQNHQAMYEWSKLFDETRPVHYENDHRFFASDICSYMYLSPSTLLQLAEQEGHEYEKPILLQEYAHAMGNGPGGLQEYMEAFRNHRRLQGGFVWEWANHGLIKTLETQPSLTYFAYGGDFGDEPNDRNFVMDGLCDSEHNAGPGLLDLKAAYAPVRIRIGKDKVAVKNEYDFKDLSDLECFVTIKSFDDGGKVTILCESKKSFPASTSKPQKETVFALPSITGPAIDDMNQIWAFVSIRTGFDSAWTSAGHEIVHACSIISTPTERINDPQLLPLTNPQIYDGDRVVLCSSGESHLAFDKVDGMLRKWSYRNRDLILDKGIKLTFWRALTDNDKTGQGNDWLGHRLDDLFYSSTSFEHKVTEDGVWRVRVRGTISPAILAYKFKTEFLYQFHRDGDLSIEVKTNPEGAVPGTLPRIGLEFALPITQDAARWFGLGPGQSYKDMKHSVTVGIWQDHIDHMNHMYEMPQESGNRTNTQWVESIDDRNVGFRARLDSIDHGMNGQMEAERPDSPLHD